MSKDRDRTVSRKDDGIWANKRNDADKAYSVHDTQKDELEITTAVIADTSWRELILYLFVTLISYIILARIIDPSPMVGDLVLRPDSIKYHIAQHSAHLFMFLFIYISIALARTLDKRFFRKNPSTTYKQIFKTSLIPTIIILGLLLLGAWYATKASVGRGTPAGL